LTLLDRTANGYVYRVEGAARVRLVPTAHRVTTDEEAALHLRDQRFDPDRNILLHDAPVSLVEGPGRTSAAASDPIGGRAVITHEDTRGLVVEAVAPQDGFLLLADMFYPGWRAEVDGVPTPIYRANISLRGIALPKGQHTVRFTYEPTSFFRGLLITAIALAALLVWLGAALYAAKRARNRLVEAN